MVASGHLPASSRTGSERVGRFPSRDERGLWGESDCWSRCMDFGRAAQGGLAGGLLVALGLLCPWHLTMCLRGRSSQPFLGVGKLNS